MRTRPPILVLISSIVLAFTCTAAEVNCNRESVPPAEIQQRVAALNSQAEGEMQRHLYKTAASRYAEAVCLVPNDARELYTLGVSQAAVGEFLESRKSLAAADRLQPSNPLPLSMLVRVNLAMGDIDGAKAALRDIASRFPDTPEIHVVLARFLTENKQLELALAESLRARRGSATEPQPTVELAALENALGAYDDAIRAAVPVENQNGIQSNVRAAAAGIAALSYEGAGNREQAIAHLQHAIELDPSRENSYLTLSFLFDNALKYDDAVRTLEAARRALPQSTALLLPLGTDLVRVQRYQDGVGVLQQALAVNADQPEACLQLANAYHQLADLPAELKTLRDLEQRHPGYPMIHVLIARALAAAQPPDYPAMLSELSRAEVASPQDPEIFYLRGKADVATNKYSQAIADFSRAIELRPADTSSYYQLARLYQKMGKHELATQLFERVKNVEQTTVR